MRRAALLLALPLLLTSCNGDTPAAQATPTPSATATATATASDDPFQDLAPPTSPGIGSFTALLANRAYAATQGYLALELLEPATLTGDNEQELVDQLQGATQDVTVARDLGAPKRAGLDIRPRLPKGATVPKPVGRVTASSYVGDEVRGLAGEDGVRITWTGTVVYPVTLAGRTSDVTYSLTVGFVFSTTPNDPSGLVMQQMVRGKGSATGVVTACLDKGVLYPGAAAGACPL